MKKRPNILIFVFKIIATTLALGQTTHAQSSNQVGFWYKPTEPGWGLSITQRGSGAAGQQGSTTQAVCFTYNAQHKPIWHSLQCTFSNNICAGTLVMASGTLLAQITDSTNFKVQQSGTAMLTVTSVNRLNLNYTVGTVSQTKFDLQPQDFAALNDVPPCTLQTASRNNATNFTGHWWGVGAQAG